MASKQPALQSSNTAQSGSVAPFAASGPTSPETEQHNKRHHEFATAQLLPLEKLTYAHLNVHPANANGL